MASRAEFYQGQEGRSFNEKAAWYITAAGIAAIIIGVAAGSASLAALGLAVTVIGAVGGNIGGKSK